MVPAVHPTGRVVRALREAQGLSLRDLAKMADVNPGYLSRVERGLEDPSARWLKNITDALGRNMASAS